jgi:hypothetical protein
MLGFLHCNRSRFVFVTYTTPDRECSSHDLVKNIYQDIRYRLYKSGMLTDISDRHDFSAIFSNGCCNLFS